MAKTPMHCSDERWRRWNNNTGRKRSAVQIAFPLFCRGLISVAQMAELYRQAMAVKMPRTSG